MPPESSHTFDVIIVGSGFGGSVSAMRLAQKGYRVGVLEAGRRFRAEDFPQTNWNIRKYLWAPHLRCFGFQKITALHGLMVLHGSGVGGGSLVYAAVLMKPLSGVFQQKGWPEGVAWEKELEPHYEEARRMLGVAANPRFFEADEALRQVGRKLGVEDSFHATDVGIYFGEPGRPVRDPYFSGEGPARTGCVFCGGCMVGCRYGAKNTLDYNYLHFAEKWGAQIIPETKVTRILPPSGEDPDLYRVETVSSTAWLRRQGPTFRASKVILAAGVLGTVELLFRNRDQHKTLKRVSPRLGDQVRTNGESLLGATSFEAHRDLSRGVAIGSAIHPDSFTKIEAVRYPRRSDLMRLLGVPLTPDGSRLSRPLKMLARAALRLPRLLRVWSVRDWAKRSLILLVMQSVEQTMRLRLGRSLRGEQTGDPVPTFLPIAQEAATQLSEVIQGEPQNVASEVLFRTPATAHILGGCGIGSDPGSGVVDSRHEVFGQPGLYVCDGSVIPVNLAVNPSLTIAAMAERFASFWPAKEDR